MVMVLLPFLVINTLNTFAQKHPGINDLNGKWQIIGDESEFHFKIKNTWVFNVKGTMGGISGEINFDKINTPDFVQLSLKPATVNTGISKRDDHLKTEDFFYTDKFPKIIFKGGQVIEVNESKNKYEVTGTLTIRGISFEKKVPITLTADYSGDKDKIEFTGSTKVERKKYNVDYSGMIIGNTAKVTYTIIAERKKK